LLSEIDVQILALFPGEWNTRKILID